MKNSMRLFLIGFLVVSVFAIVGCFGNLAKDQVSSEPPIVMKIGHTQPMNHPRHQSLLRFKALVEAKTNHAVEVQIYPAGQLGSDEEQMEMVKRGTLQATRGNQLEAAAPEFLIYSMPFLFKNIESAHKITRGTIGAKIAKFAEKNNIIVLATGDVGGLRDITNNRKPIVDPKDMQGLNMRTPPIESTVKTMEAMGAHSLPVPYEELYMALKTGVVDGQENPLVNITALKLDEVQKYLTIIDYQYLPDPFFVNLQWYNSLDTGTQEIIKEASVEMMVYSDDLVKTETNNSLVKLQKSMSINTLTGKQKEKFIEYVKPVYAYYLSKGLFTAQDLKEIKNAVQ